MDGVDPKLEADRHDQRHHHRDGRVDIHDAADEQQQDIEHQQKHPGGMDVRGGPFDQLIRHLFHDQVMGEPHGHTEDEQDAAHQQSALGHDPGNVTKYFKIAIYPGLDGEGVERGDCRRLDRGGFAAEQRSQRHHWQQQFPFRLPHRAPGLDRIESTRSLGDARADANSPPRGQPHQQNSGGDAAQEHLLDGDLAGGTHVRGDVAGHNRIEDQRQTRRKQQPEGAGRRQQAERVPFRIARGQEHRHEQTAQGENGHA